MFLQELSKLIQADHLNEDYVTGDVVAVHQQVKGKDMGLYGKFNVDKVTPTQVHVYDHKQKKILKFNAKTLRGIGEHDGLMLVKEVREAALSTNVGNIKDILAAVGEKFGALYQTKDLGSTLDGWHAVVNSSLAADERSDKGLEEKNELIAALKKAGHEAKLGGPKNNQVIFKAAHAMAEEVDLPKHAIMSFSAIEKASDDDGVAVLVFSNVQDDDYYDDYHGVNVCFDHDGKFVDLVAADPKAEYEAEHYKTQIIAAARKELEHDRPMGKKHQ